MPMPESPVELTSEIFTPSTGVMPKDEIDRMHKQYLLARKDLTLSRLDQSEIIIVRLFNIIIDGERNLGYYDAAYMDEHEFLVWLAAKRAVGGKERDAANTINQNVNADYNGHPPTVVQLGNSVAPK